MKRLAGYDLNGWRDLAVRNWVQQPGDDDEFGSDAAISGGIDGCVVSLIGEDGKQKDDKPKYVGGAQAELAPHGLGVGWGDVGAPGRRVRVRALIASPDRADGAEDRLAASLAGLARRTDVGVLAIADIGVVTEEAQEALIEAMRRAGVRRRLLVWRPVLALLGAMRARGFEERERIGIVTHEAPGFGTQILTLRQGKVLAPERRRKGRLHRSALGLLPLCDRVFDRLFETAGQRSHYLEVSSIPARVVLGERVGAKVLRRDNGSWEKIQPPALPAFDDPEGLDEVAEALRDCDRVFFETPSRGFLAERIVDELSHRLDVDVCGLPPETVATGARVAAERLNDGVPVFFDFLPQISTIISGEERARNFDLIPGDDLLPAGEIYRSREPATFAILPGQDHISVFIRKETVPGSRLAEIPLGQPITETTTVELSVEQRPVSGRARLTLSSRAFVTPQIVDFDAAQPQEQSWEEIIESRKRTRPTIPDRMILPNGLDVWDGVAGPGLSAILAECRRSDAPNWELLAHIMAARPEGRYALSSDGEPPQSIRAADLEAFDQMLNRAESEVHRRIRSRHNPDNHPLRFTTWAFRRCPQSLIAPMLETLDSTVGKHPLLLAGGTRTLIYQGLGRTLRNDKDMRRVMDHLFGLPFDTWNKNHIACMGFLISRTDEAPRLLQRKEVDTLAKVVATGLKAETVRRTYWSTFIYLPILLVGLLRWRMVEPDALVSKRDPAADLMDKALDGVIQDLESRRYTVPRLRKHYDLLCKSRDELAGEGGHSDLLVELYGLQ